MSTIAPPERVTQQRVIALFRDELKYDYLGDWHDRNNNRQIEDGLLTDWLTRRGCSQAQIGIVLHKLHTEAGQLRAQGGGAVVADRGHAVLAGGSAALRNRRAARGAGQ